VTIHAGGQTDTLKDTDHDKTQLHLKLHVLSKCDFFQRNPYVLLYRIRHFYTFQCTGKYYKNNNFNYTFNCILKFYVTSGNEVNFSLWQKKTEGKMDGRKKKDRWTNRVLQTNEKLYMSLITLVPFHAHVLLTILISKICFYSRDWRLGYYIYFQIKKMATNSRRLDLLPSAGRMGDGETLFCWNRWEELVLMYGKKTQYRLLEDRQCRCNVIMRRVHVTIVAVRNQLNIKFVSAAVYLLHALIAGQQ
jgi:hypothetical protein